MNHPINQLQVRSTWQVSSLSNTIPHCIGRIIVKPVAMGAQALPPNHVGPPAGRDGNRPVSALGPLEEAEEFLELVQGCCVNLVEELGATRRQLVSR